MNALDSAKGVKLTGDTFAMVKGVLGDAASSAAARIQAATMIASAPLDKEQQTSIAPLLATVGPVELDKLVPLLRKPKDADMARTFATELAKNPAIASQQESIYRTALADKPVDIFETIILPAYNKAVAATEAKKRMLPALSEKVTAKGDAAAGRKHFEMGKGTCIACHKIGDVGRPIGPDLSKIGSIRTERDLLESILFPSNTLARDYEAHIIETNDGQSTMGVIKSHTAEGLLVIDIAGQEKTVAHTAITRHHADHQPDAHGPRSDAARAGDVRPGGLSAQSQVGTPRQRRLRGCRTSGKEGTAGREPVWPAPHPKEVPHDEHATARRHHYAAQASGRKHHPARRRCARRRLASRLGRGGPAFLDQGRICRAGPRCVGGSGGAAAQALPEEKESVLALRDGRPDRRPGKVGSRNPAHTSGIGRKRYPFREG